MREPWALLPPETREDRPTLTAHPRTGRQGAVKRIWVGDDSTIEPISVYRRAAAAIRATRKDTR